MLGVAIIHTNVLLGINRKIFFFTKKNSTNQKIDNEINCQIKKNHHFNYEKKFILEKWSFPKTSSSCTVETN